MSAFGDVMTWASLPAGDRAMAAARAVQAEAADIADTKLAVRQIQGRLWKDLVDAGEKDVAAAVKRATVSGGRDESSFMAVTRKLALTVTAKPGGVEWSIAYGDPKVTENGGPVSTVVITKVTKPILKAIEKASGVDEGVGGAASRGLEVLRQLAELSESDIQAVISAATGSGVPGHDTGALVRALHTVARVSGLAVSASVGAGPS